MIFTNRSHVIGLCGFLRLSHSWDLGYPQSRLFRRSETVGPPRFLYDPLFAGPRSRDAVGRHAPHPIGARLAAYRNVYCVGPRHLDHFGAQSRGPRISLCTLRPRVSLSDATLGSGLVASLLPGRISSLRGRFERFPLSYCFLLSQALPGAKTLRLDWKRRPGWR